MSTEVLWGTMQPFATVLAAIVSAGLGAILAYVLGIRRTEREQRSLRLQERRAEIIAKMHAMLLEIHLGFERVMEYYQTEEPERRAVQDKLLSQQLNQFRDFCKLHAVWLDDDMWRMLYQVSEDQRQKRAVLNRPRLPNGNGARHREVPAEVRQWVRQDLPKTMDTLKHEFRQILGVKATSSDQVGTNASQAPERGPWAFLGALLSVSGFCLVYVQFGEGLEGVKRVDWEFGVTALGGGLLIGLGLWMIVCRFTTR